MLTNHPLNFILFYFRWMYISWFDNRIMLVSQVLLWSRGRSWALKKCPLVSWRFVGPPASTSQLSQLSTSCKGGGTLASSPARTLPPPGRLLHRLGHCTQRIGLNQMGKSLGTFSCTHNCIHCSVVPNWPNKKWRLFLSSFMTAVEDFQLPQY